MARDPARDDAHDGAAPVASHPVRRWIGGLDGLRAVAVIAVVLFHLDPGYLSGGFLGVDLFFVISGYLITRLLLAERAATGTISLGRFYVRRARRLLPAVAALLVIVSTVGYYLWPDQRSTLPNATLSSIGYVTNWWLIGDHQSYFVSMGRPPMLQHLWSLAIEEQYYLLWAPVVLIASAGWVTRRLTRGRMPMVVAGIAAAAAIASTLTMAIIAIRTDIPYQADSSRVYFGTDTHAMGLLLGSAVGALSALSWRSLQRRPPRWVRPAWRSAWVARPLIPAWIVGGEGRRPLGVWASDLLAVAALAGVGWFFVTVDEYVPWLYRGGFLLFAAVAAVAIAGAARPGSVVGRLLDLRPLKWIGTRSYGIYLWHWPIFVVTRPAIDVFGPTWLVDLARSGLAVAVAAASYRYLETPIRLGTLRATWRGALAHLTQAPALAPTVRTARWVTPTLAAACVAVLVTAHMASVPEPAWAGSVTSAALPIPGVTPDVTGEISAAGRDGDGSGGGAPTPIVGVPGSGGGYDGPAATVTEPARGVVASTTTAPPTPTVLRHTDAPMSTTAAVAPPKTTTAPRTTTTKARQAAPSTTKARPAAVSGFGDSVLLGAAPAVRSVVGTMSLDAVVGRQAWDTLADVTAAQVAHRLSPVVLIHTGNNGIISPKQLTSTLAALANRTKVLLVNDHVDRSWQGPNNRTIAAVGAKFKNVAVLDWNALATKNPGWFGPDGIHVNQAGGRAYASMVAAAMP